jgi:hypothetical protein
MEYLCDIWAQVEARTAHFHKSPAQQAKYRGARVAAIEDQLSAGGRADEVGQPVVRLPSSFVGSARYYQQLYMDAMALPKKFGKPDLFLTFTCNPNWPEIVDNMKGFEAGPNSRPDLIARVFQIKLKSLIEDLEESSVLGNIRGYMYTVEWQKRGLPHAHILLFLSEDSQFRTPADVDQRIRAEIPNPTTHPDLWELVTNNMIHGPCGKIEKPDQKEPRQCCRKNGTCEDRFPKELRSDTFIAPDDYPAYRRRSKSEGGHTFYHKDYRCEIGNDWVVTLTFYENMALILMLKSAHH